MLLVGRPAGAWRLEAMDFDLWIETEHVDGLIDDFCNVLVTLQTGEGYALNVWTFAFFDVARRRGEETASRHVAGRYLLPPDLFVGAQQPVPGDDRIRHQRPAPAAHDANRLFGSPRRLRGEDPQRPLIATVGGPTQSL